MLASRTVFVVDDDANLSDSVCALVNSMGYPAKSFPSAEAFLAGYVAGDRGVVVVDLRMPGMNGLALQEELARRKCHLPIVILTAHARSSITVRAMQAGAVTLIDKPYHDDDLWNAVRAALEKEEVAWTAAERRREIGDRLSALTPDERRVMDLIVEGKPNKAIANKLGVALRTVEKRRHAVLAKMKAGSVAELVELVIEVRSL
jgi:two-component system, LuxR family, response regulator FixJ